MVGILLGAGISAGAELMDDRIFSEKELKERISTVIISEIPDLATPKEREKHTQISHTRMGSDRCCVCRDLGRYGT